MADDFDQILDDLDPVPSDGGGTMVTTGRYMFGGVEGPPPPAKETLAEPFVPNLFSEAWGEEAFARSALLLLWHAEWRHLTEPNLPDPRDPKAVKGKDG